MPRLASERVWYTPLVVVGAVALLIAVYAVLMWVVAMEGKPYRVPALPAIA